ncbi:MAG TPA: 1-deoxy-D-xylulose-5-phosphate reductoisomerase, partial [Herbaspirillum sp.]|nr:1-deoxy-D-xylulose-5-phosphate reductoisomerase [Herbaspirillum sp.]
MQAITVLGSTGSIGVSTLDVVGRHPDRYCVYALTAHTRVDALAQQCARFQPRLAVVGTAQAAQQLQQKLRALQLRTEVLYGSQSLCDVAGAAECH